MNKQLLWWLLLLLVVAIAAVAFWPIHLNDLVWDDWGNLAKNSRYRGLGGENVEWAFTTLHEGAYQPLAWLSFGLDHAIYGTSPKGFHRTNLVLHLLNTILFAFVARALLRRVWATEGGDGSRSRVLLGSILSAAVFSLHPLRMESVAWLAQRGGLVGGVFFLLSVLAYLRAARLRDEQRFSSPWWIASLVLFGLSLLGSPLGMGLPFVLLVLDFYPLRRWSQGSNRSPWGLLLSKLPFVALSIACGVRMLDAQSQNGSLLSLADHGVFQRLAQAAYSAVFYLRSLVAGVWYPLHERPFDLNPLDNRFVLSALGFIAVTAALIHYRRRFPAGLPAWVAYLILLAPFSGLIQSGPQLVADRFSYLACLSWALVLGGGGAVLWAGCRSRGERTLWTLWILAVVGVMAGSTWQQTKVWSREKAMWTHVAKSGTSALAESRMAGYALKEDDIGAAMRHTLRVMEIAPTYGPAWREMEGLLTDAKASWSVEQLREVAARLDKNVAYHSDKASAWFVLGLARDQLGEHELAVEYYEKTVSIQPKFVKGWLELGYSQLETGRAEAAIASFTEAAERAPEYAPCWKAKGIALRSAGRFEEGTEALKRAAELDPYDPETANLLQAE